MLGIMLMIVIVVWAIKELAEGTGISDRVRYGKQTRNDGE
jgi:hypothetical protein